MWRGHKELNNIKMSNQNQASEASRAEGRSPFLLWLIWIVWVPLSIPAFLKLFQAHLPLPQLIATLFGVALFFGIYLLASWRRAVDLVATSTLPRHTEAFTWLTIAALTILGLILTLLGGSEWQTLFYYTSGYVGGEPSHSSSDTGGFCDHTTSNSNWLVRRTRLARSCANRRFHPCYRFYYEKCDVVDHYKLAVE